MPTESEQLSAHYWNIQKKNEELFLALAAAEEKIKLLEGKIKSFETKATPRRCGECQWCLEDEEAVRSVGGKLPCPRPVTIYGPSRPLRPTKPADKK